MNNNRLQTLDILGNSGISFGTSGARGLVSDFSPDVCMAFTYAFLSNIQKSFDFKEVAIAIDNRPSSFDIAMACARAVLDAGFRPIYYGVIPTPALAYTAMQDFIPAIMVTGSHIPFDRNGLKFYRPDGEITKDDESAILNCDNTFDSLSQQPSLEVNNSAGKRYIQRYTSLFPADVFVGKRVGIYEHSSAGRELYRELFESLGAIVISLGRSDEFVPIDTEAVSDEDSEKAKSWSTQHSLDVIFSTDGDGDRPLVADEKGNWLRGDILGLLCAKFLKIEALSVPVSCSTAIERSDYFASVTRTRIGSPYVIASMETLKLSYSSVAGFEANGGFLLGSDIHVNDFLLTALPTRDAVLPVLMLLMMANDDGISSCVDRLPNRFTYSDRLQDFPVKLSREIIAFGMHNPEKLIQKLGFGIHKIHHVDSTDGLRITFCNGDIVHLRPSGNAPELRCYAESDSYELAKDYVSITLGNAHLIIP